MPSSRSETPRSSFQRRNLLLLALLSLLSPACSTAPKTDTILTEAPQGAVFLRQIADPSFHTGHPVELDASVIGQVLGGILIQEQQRTLQSIVAGPSTPTQAFLPEDVQFLAPSVAKALASAARDQIVGFRLTHSHSGSSALESSTTEITAGFLSVEDGILRLWLTQYRYAPSRTTGAGHRRPPDASGLSERRLSFTPAIAQRPGDRRPSWIPVSTDHALLIDYRLLQRQGAHPGAEPSMTRPAPSIEPARPAAQPAVSTDASSPAAPTIDRRDEEIRGLKDLVIKKDLELEALRKDVQSLKRAQESQKRKSKSPSKSPIPTP